MKKRGVYQRRQPKQPLDIHSQSLAAGVTQQLYAKPKPAKSAPKKYVSGAPSARPVGGGMGNM